MRKPECGSCRMRGVCRESANSWIFFFIGIVATVSLRIIEPLRVFDPVYAKTAWYVGVAGFLVFFVYKYRILNARSKIIRESGLMEKLASSSGLTGEDYLILAEIVCSQDNWKERFNFIVIFALSGLALALAVYMEYAANPTP